MTKHPQPKSYKLENSEQLHREHPRSYSIPRRDQRYKLEPNQLVKLVFLLHEPTVDQPRAERMWVEVKDVHHRYYIGTLQNQLHHISNLKLGDTIEFGPQYIAALYQSDETRQLPLGKYALVSQKIVFEDAWPHSAQRLAANDDHDSDWRVFDEAETDIEVANLDGFVAYSVDELLQLYRILDSILDEPIGTAWQWDEEFLEYKANNKK